MPVVAYESVYEVSDRGRVRRVAGGQGTRGRGHILRQNVQANGYAAVSLVTGGRQMTHRVHRLVLRAFVGPCPVGAEACHGDGNRTNSRLDNLRWGTRSENEKDKQRHGTFPTRRCPGCGRDITGPSFFTHAAACSRHQQILALKSQGLRRKAIADRLGMTDAGVKYALKAVLKAGVLAEVTKQ